MRSRPFQSRASTPVESSAWYERSLLSAIVGILAGLLAEGIIWHRWGARPPAGLSYLAVFCYGGAFIYDLLATHRHISLKDEFDRRGLVMPTCEGNPLLPAYPTMLQQIWSPATLLSVLYMPLIILLPGVGFGAAILHGLAGAANERVYQRSIEILRWSDSRRQPELFVIGS